MKNIITKVRNLTVKQSVLLGVGIVIVLIAAVATWQHFAWQRYVDYNDRLYAEARKDAKQQLRGADQPESLYTLASSTLREPSAKLCQASALADVHIKIADYAKEYQQACEERSDKLLEAAKYAQQLSDRLATEQRAADLLKEVGGALKQSKEGDYEAQQKIWQKAKTDLSGIEVDDSYSKSLQLQLAAIDPIVECYDGLIAADQAEKRGQFDDAAVELREAYAAMAATNDEVKASYRPLVEQLQTAVAGL